MREENVNDFEHIRGIPECSKGEKMGFESDSFGNENSDPPETNFPVRSLIFRERGHTEIERVFRL